MAAPPTYPRRPRFFACKFVRAMAKVCLANDLTPDCCWLLTVIAHTEDAAGYRAVTFHNGQLVALTGFGSVDKLKRERAKAVAAGWLHYVPGRRGIAARYWVLIPPQFQGLDDLPSDEYPEKYGGVEPEESAPTGRTRAPETAPSRGGQPEQPASMGHGDAPETALSLHQKPSGNRPRCALETAPGPHNLLPVPGPLPQPGPTDPQTPGVGRSVERFDPLRESERNRKQFVERWNAAGLRTLTRLSHGLWSRLEALLGDPWWAEHYPAALSHAGSIPFLAAGVDRQKGPLDVSEFLRDDDFVRKVLDGLFDPRPAGGPAAPARSPVQQRIDAVLDRYRSQAQEPAA